MKATNHKTQAQPAPRRVIDVLRNAQKLGCRLVIENGEVVTTREMKPGQQPIGFAFKVAA